MADQNITALPKKVSSGIAATDYMLGIDSAEGYQMLIQDLGDYIIQHATSSLAGSNQTLANAISALNSKFPITRLNSVESLKYDDGRVQVKYHKNDNQTVDVITYDPNVGMKMARSSDNQQSFTDVWEFNKSIPQQIETLNSKTSGTLLWSGSTTLDGGTITLSSPVTNFTWLLFVFKTNNEIATCHMKADHATTEHPYATIQAGEWITDANRFQYCAWSSLTKTSNTTYDVTCKYNNQNFICKPCAVWGF